LGLGGKKKRKRGVLLGKKFKKNLGTRQPLNLLLYLLPEPEKKVTRSWGRAGFIGKNFSKEGDRTRKENKRFALRWKSPKGGGGKGAGVSIKPRGKRRSILGA